MFAKHHVYLFIFYEYNYRRVRRRAEVNVTETHGNARQPGLKVLLAQLLLSSDFF